MTQGAWVQGPYRWLVYPAPRKLAMPVWASVAIGLVLLVAGLGVYTKLEQTQDEEARRQQTEQEYDELARRIHQYCLDHPLDEVNCPNRDR